MEIRELGHLVLYVRDLERSRTFYRDVLGFDEVGAFGHVGVAFSSGRTHHELLLLQAPTDAPGPLRGARVGLYHVGLKVGEHDDDLRAALDELREHGVSVTGASDHVVTHSVYIEDPDGNELELYVDVTDAWREQPDLVLAPPRPLHL